MPILECSRCILTSDDDTNLSIDEDGICNNCRSFDVAWKDLPHTEDQVNSALESVFNKINNQKGPRDYDCLIGVSGGVDSTYLAMLVTDLGLNPLAVHFDNGWNSELAVKNIENLVSKLDIDLITYVIDWNDFKALQLAYIRASVIDIEVLTDHAIYGALYKLAEKHNIKYIVSGVNVATEHVLPNAWIYNKLDYINIQNIYDKYGDGRKLGNYPFVNERVRRFIKASGIEIIRLLDLVNFNHAMAKVEITNRVGWQAYEGKHFESIFTRFYQGYILPKKFGVNKRKAHLSNLVCSGQLTRESALSQIKAENYSAQQQQDDRGFVLKKLGLSNQEFDQILALPQRAHRDFYQLGSFFGHNKWARPLEKLWRKYRG